MAEPQAYEARDSQPIQVFTVGHSTRTLEEFLEVLKAHQIAALVDIRSYPASRRHPQFNKSNLERSLFEAGIHYYHFRELGGRRRPRPDSKNTAWANPGFRGYADYMETEPFRTGIERLLLIAGSKRTAIMCAEAVWWKCHRSMVSDYLKAKGAAVVHVLSATKAEPHGYTAAARIIDGELSYRGLI